ncbi:hypothetical protein [Pseudomonas gingeri]|uniref:hypothetical protein n=1 Tax=Pseudomonas gingeri TaxID=117681 RepID=UPI003FA2DBD6
MITVQLPPLRERQSDIVLLAEHFLRSASAGRGPKRLSTQAIQSLVNHSWPGNVRELRNAMQRAALLGKGTVINVQAPASPTTNMNKISCFRMLIFLKSFINYLSY